MASSPRRSISSARRPRKVAPKPVTAHTIVGTAVKRLDIPNKVTGGAAYVQDMRPPGMLHGRVVRPPRYGSKLESVDEAGVKAMPGVVAVVRDGSFLGVVAEREEQAVKARAALIKSAKWTLGPALPDPATIYEHLMSLPTEDTVISEKHRRRSPSPAACSRPQGDRGDLSQALHGAWLDRAVLRARPSSTTASITVWTHSQGVFPNRARLAEALGMKPTEIRCVHADGSGCYGHNGADDVALDAALLARARARHAGAACNGCATTSSAGSRTAPP